MNDLLLRDRHFRVDLLPCGPEPNERLESMNNFNMMQLFYQICYYILFLKHEKYESEMIKYTVMPQIKFQFQNKFNIS